MTINLEEWVGKRVKVTQRYGNHYEDNVIIRNSSHTKYPYYLKGKMHTGFFYEKDGTSSWINGYYDIILIEEIPMKTEHLEQQIKATQEQLTKLQEELKKVQKQEKFNDEFYTPIVSNGNLRASLELLKMKNSSLLFSSFDWSVTPQGFNYWRSRRDCNNLTEEDYNLIRKWVVNYLIQRDLNDF